MPFKGVCLLGDSTIRLGTPPNKKGVLRLAVTILASMSLQTKIRPVYLNKL